MKEGIHPKYDTTTVRCGCGSTFETRSTAKKVTLDICSQCHPFFTGKLKFVDTAGRVEKFQKKYKNWIEQRGGTVAAPAAEAETEEPAEA